MSALRTPSRASKTSIQDIVRHDDASPLRNRNTTPAIGNVTPMPPRAIAGKTSVGDILQGSSSSSSSSSSSFAPSTPSRAVPQRDSAFFNDLQNGGASKTQQKPRQPATPSHSTAAAPAPVAASAVPSTPIATKIPRDDAEIAVLKAALQEGKNSTFVCLFVCLFVHPFMSPHGCLNPSRNPRSQGEQ